jgi:hypothetical protein
MHDICEPICTVDFGKPHFGTKVLAEARELHKMGVNNSGRRPVPADV